MSKQTYDTNTPESTGRRTMYHTTNNLVDYNPRLCSPKKEGKLCEWWYNGWIKGCIKIRVWQNLSIYICIYIYIYIYVINKCEGYTYICNTISNGGLLIPSMEGIIIPTYSEYTNIGHCIGHCCSARGGHHGTRFDNLNH